MAAVLAGARPHVDEVVGGAHRALVVLDHEHGVAEVAQPLERRDQLLVVALVQPDRRLVEDVQHARPATSRSAWPAGSAGPRRPTASPRRAPSTGSRRRRSRGTAAAPRSRAAPAARSAGRARRARARAPSSSARRADSAVNSWIAVLADQHRARLGPQPRALALRARSQRHVLLDLLARPVGVGLAIAPLEVGDDALERRRVRAAAAEPVAVGDLQAVAVGAVQEELAAHSAGSSSHGVSRSTS